MQQSQRKPKDTCAVDDLLRAASVELPPRANPKDLSGRFPVGTDVYIAFLPADDMNRIVDAAASIRRAGYNPVPHVAAHEIGTKAALDGFLGRLVGEAGVRRVLVVAGDSSVVRGPYPTTSSVLESGLLQRNGILAVDVGGHPEGNAHFTPEAGIETLAHKIEIAKRDGLDLGVVTQFCFGAAPLVDWLHAVRRHCLNPRVRLGLAGPASLPTLMKFALRCGIGNSMRALRPNIGRFGRLLNDAGPDEVVDGIAQALPDLVAVRLQGFHVFAFGGLKNSSQWIGARLAGRQAELVGSD